MLKQRLIIIQKFFENNCFIAKTQYVLREFYSRHSQPSVLAIHRFYFSRYKNINSKFMLTVFKRKLPSFWGEKTRETYFAYKHNCYSGSKIKPITDSSEVFASSKSYHMMCFMVKGRHRTFLLIMQFMLLQ